MSAALDWSAQTTVCAFCRNFPGRCCQPSCDGRASIAVVDDDLVEHARCLSHVSGVIVRSAPLPIVRPRSSSTPAAE